jgi:hypothetical protein|tara:strand:+ start:876 stop:1085 length:210 start_codon:yes stop_codon:yes gene_type:complete
MENKYILSWLPTQDSDKVYPLKDVTIIETDKKGYSKTEWQMSKATIIERNETQGITERERVKAEAISMR